MGIEYGIKNGALLWIRNPFTGAVVYFNEIHRKPHSFRRLTNTSQPHSIPQAPSPETFHLEAQRVQNACVFCPGNEAQTMHEVLRLSYRDVYPLEALPTGCAADDWAMRVIHNIVPRIPEVCTGGRNESYVIMEDARHFLPEATGLGDVMWSGALPAAHFEQTLRLATRVMRSSMENPAVKSVLIRKHQGRESGASQPHIHMQVIGADRVFPDLAREIEATARNAEIWDESVDLMRTFGFQLEAGDGMVTQWSPFGSFSRHFEVISLEDRQPLPAISESRLQLFAQCVHRLLQVMGPGPYDLEIHHGAGIPLHLHLNTRRYVYANIGGTLNVPSDLAETILPPTRERIQALSQQMRHTQASRDET
jgi:galactose-1-phosphate uridylyltransferase